MRTSLRSRHASVSVGCLGTVVVAAVLIGAVMLIAELGLVLVAVGVPSAVISALVIRAVDRPRRGIWYRPPRLPARPARYVRQDRWPHAVRDGSWLHRR